MKKIAIALAALVAASAQGAPEKVLEIRVASGNGLVEAATKLGRFVEYPALGSLVQRGLGNQPLAAEYGARRPDAAIYGVLRFDADAFSVDSPAAAYSGAMLYPTALTKAEFLAAHTNATEEADGTVKYDDDSLLFADGVGFAVGYPSGTADLALLKSVVDEARSSAPLAAGDVLTVNMPAALWRAVGKLLPQLQELDESGMKALKLLDEFADASLSLRVTDAGLDFDASCAFVPGGELAKLGGKALAGGDPLAFADKDAQVACAYAADMGQGAFDAQVSKAIAVLAQHGVATGRFLKYRKTGDVARFDIDIPALVAYLTDDSFEFTGDFDSFVKDIDEALSAEFKAESPALSVVEYFAGMAANESPSVRFAKAMPEFAGKPLAHAGVFSLYALAKGATAQVLEALPAEATEELGALKSACRALPDETGAAVASATFRDGGRLRSVVRITPMELKGLFQAAQVGITVYQMFKD